MKLSDHDLLQLTEKELLELPEDVVRRLSIKLLTDLKEARKRLKQTSRNSSRPPSSDKPWDNTDATDEQYDRQQHDNRKSPQGAPVDSDKHLDARNTKNEVFRKIGRNIILFQQFEYWLKFIIANGSFSGSASELNLIKEQGAASIQKQTMGNLVGKYLATTNPKSQESSEEIEEPKEAFISFKYSIECDPVYFEIKKDTLAQMVSDRNELVHHMLPKFDTNSLESCNQTEKQLDDQSEKIIFEINELSRQASSLQASYKMLAELLTSHHFELVWLQQSPLVLMLGDIAVQAGKADGWVSLTKASQLIWQQVPEEVVLLTDVTHPPLKTRMILG